MNRTICVVWGLAAGLAVVVLANVSALAASPSDVTPQASMNVWEKAHDAILRGDTKSARASALQMLQENTDPKAWYYGNVIYEANQILGLAALSEGNVKEAKEYLLAAGRTPGSPQLHSFGPDMELARKLLARGEKEVVIEYLDLVAQFWAWTPETKLREDEKRVPGSAALVRKIDHDHRLRIEEWKRQVRAGKQPDLECD